MNKNSMNLVRRKLVFAIEYYMSIGEVHPVKDPKWSKVGPSKIRVTQNIETEVRSVAGLRKRLDPLLEKVESLQASANDFNSSYLERRELEEMVAVISFLRRGRLDLRDQPSEGGFGTYRMGAPSLGKRR